MKSGNVSVKDVRELCEVVNANKAAIGVLITLETPTKPMRAWAADAGTYAGWNTSFPKIQILTIEELLGGKRVAYPGEQTNATFKRAPIAKAKPGAQVEMFGPNVAKAGRKLKTSRTRSSG